MRNFIKSFIVEEEGAEIAEYALLIVILTSSKQEQDLMESYDIGANSYIRKPVDYLQFIEAVRQLKLYWLLLNVPPPHGR